MSSWQFSIGNTQTQVKCDHKKWISYAGRQIKMWPVITGQNPIICLDQIQPEIHFREDSIYYILYLCSYCCPLLRRNLIYKILSKKDYRHISFFNPWKFSGNLNISFHQFLAEMYKQENPWKFFMEWCCGSLFNKTKIL